jgi:hypothetical protein
MPRRSTCSTLRPLPIMAHAGLSPHPPLPRTPMPPGSMAGQLHTAEAFARGIRTLRERVSGKWMSPGTEYTSLPLVLAR